MAGSRLINLSYCVKCIAVIQLPCFGAPSVPEHEACNVAPAASEVSAVRSCTILPPPATANYVQYSYRCPRCGESTLHPRVDESDIMWLNMLRKEQGKYAKSGCREISLDETVLCDRCRDRSYVPDFCLMGGCPQSEDSRGRGFEPGTELTIYAMDEGYAYVSPKNPSFMLRADDFDAKGELTGESVPIFVGNVSNFVFVSRIPRCDAEKCVKRQDRDMAATGFVYVKIPPDWTFKGVKIHKSRLTGFKCLGSHSQRVDLFDLLRWRIDGHLVHIERKDRLLLRNPFGPDTLYWDKCFSERLDMMPKPLGVHLEAAIVTNSDVEVLIDL